MHRPEEGSLNMSQPTSLSDEGSIVSIRRLSDSELSTRKRATIDPQHAPSTCSEDSTSNEGSFISSSVEDEDDEDDDDDDDDDDDSDPGQLEQPPRLPEEPVDTEFDNEKLFTKEEFQTVFSRSYKRWKAALTAAKSMRPGQFPDHVYDLKALLFRIPAIPDEIPNSMKTLEGYSTWKSSDITCPLETITEAPHRFAFRYRKPLRFAVSTSADFQVWDGTPNNGIALLVLAWAYILNANLLERQGLEIQSVPFQSEGSTPTSPHTSITTLDLSYADQRELAWWRAITKPDATFQAVDEQFYPRWSVCIEDIGRIRVVGKWDGVEMGDDDLSLPSSQEAAVYLARLCAAYNLGNQCSAALAAVLCFPLHTIVKPPKPRFTSNATNYLNPSEIRDPPPDFKHLSYYLTLGMSRFTLATTLDSSFWEPDVPCTLAGASMRPIRLIITPEIQCEQHELLVKIISFSRAAPLWLGTMICGHYPWMSATLDNSLWNYLDARDTAAWTGIPNSFMDLQRPGPYLRGGMVTRADVWRLRHDCHGSYDGYVEDYSDRPINGWEPFGSMAMEDVELEIRDHLLCSHQWSYSHWTWRHNSHTDAGFVPDGRPSFSTHSLLDPRLNLSITEPLHDDDDGKEPRLTAADAKAIRLISRFTTESTFRWCYNQVERGLTGTVVPPRHFGDSPISSESRASSVESEWIKDWLERIPSETPSQTDSILCMKLTAA